jgi:hypothetical protein
VARLDLSHFALGYKDCSPQATLYTSDHIQKIVPITWETLTTQAPQQFKLPALKQTVFSEAQHYLDRSIYHLIAGKRNIADGYPTWGLVSFYYASFFAAQCAIRLRGLSFVRIDYRKEIAAPTYRLEVVNLLTDEFCVRKAGGTGEHVRVWNAFYDLYSGLANDGRWAEFWPVTEESEPERRLAEMHRRHLVNYVPGFGYVEAGPIKVATALIAALSRDVLANLTESLEEPDQQLEAKAFLRAKLCVRLLLEIVRRQGAYSRLHETRMTQRRGWLSSLKCPSALSNRLDGVLSLKAS